MGEFSIADTNGMVIGRIKVGENGDVQTWDYDVGVFPLLQMVGDSVTITHVPEGSVEDPGNWVAEAHAVSPVTD